MTTTLVTGPYPQPLEPQDVGHSGEVEACWETVLECPACASNAATRCGTLPDRYYAFGGERMPLPDSGIAVSACEGCGLIYKAMVPTSAFLAAVFQRQRGTKWVGTHDFSTEAILLQRLAGTAVFDLLDVGATDGALLKACAESGVQGRRSALDVIRYPGLEAQLAGEFIEGFLDVPSLSWSRDPYDLVTLFDVLEHFYRPRIAFENLRSLVRSGGLVFIETGNADSFWPRHFGIHEWWYVRLIEHHIFWSRRSLESMASAFGFEVVFWAEGRHKSRREVFRPGIAAELAKVGLYCLVGGRYAGVAQRLGRQGNQPWYPFARDHFQVCLRKE